MSKSRLSKRNLDGFTLIELMIVIVLLGVLIAAGLGSFVSSQQKGRDNRRKTDLKNMVEALETYYNDYGRYPGDDGNGQILGCGTNGTAVCPSVGCSGVEWTAGGAAGCSTTYMATLPADPSTGRKYFYRYNPGSGGYYQIYAALENVFDANPGVKQDGYAGTNCASSGVAILCTYGISSPNTTP